MEHDRRLMFAGLKLPINSAFRSLQDITVQTLNVPSLLNLMFGLEFEKVKLAAFKFGGIK